MPDRKPLADRLFSDVNKREDKKTKALVSYIGKKAAHSFAAPGEGNEGYAKMVNQHNKKTLDGFIKNPKKKNAQGQVIMEIKPSTFADQTGM